MKIVPSDTPILASDRAFNYGDGVFTTICVENYTPQLIDLHLSRLCHDANAIGLQLEQNRLMPAICNEIERLKVDALQSDNLHSDSSSDDRYVLKVHVSGGDSGRGYARDKHTPPIVRFSQHAYPANYASLEKSGLSLICAQTTLAIQPLLAGVKHLNRLEQVLVKQEVVAKGVDDAIVCDTQDNVIEASAGNVFFFAQGTWYTPSLKGCGVNGVVRQALVQALHNENTPLQVGEYSLKSLEEAEAVVVTNALMGVTPVKRIAFNDEHWVDYNIDNAAIRYLQSLLRIAVYGK